MLRALDESYIGVANCNREFEGDILEKGSRVKICGLDPVSVGNYVKNTDLDAPETLSDTYKELVIDQAKYFTFQIDDVDQAQASPRLMDLAVKNAANELVKVAERYVYSFNSLAKHSVNLDNPSVDNIIDALIKARTLLQRENVSDPSDIVIEVSPEVAGLILRAKINLATDNSEALEKGCIGSIGGSKIFVSSNIPVCTEEEVPYAQCIARTKRAVAFAEQLSEVEAYRPELRFADAMKGLHLYGAKIVYPNEMVMINVAMNFD
jgi:hypothetical protein